MVIIKWFKKKIAEREEQIWREDKDYREGMARRQAERKLQLEKDAREKEAKKVFYGTIREQQERRRRQSQPSQQATSTYYDSLPQQIIMHNTFIEPTGCGGRSHKVTHNDSFADNSYGSSNSSSLDSGSSSSSSSSYDSSSSCGGGGSFD